MRRFLGDSPAVVLEAKEGMRRVNIPGGLQRVGRGAGGAKMTAAPDALSFGRVGDSEEIVLADACGNCLVADREALLDAVRALYPDCQILVVNHSKKAA